MSQQQHHHHFWNPHAGNSAAPRNSLRNPNAAFPDPVRASLSGWGKRRCRSSRKNSEQQPDSAQTPVATKPLPEVPELASDFCAQFLPISFDSWQLDFINSKSARKALLGSRQCGKSTAIAALAVHRVLRKPETQVIIVASSRRQSAILVDKCRWILRKIGVDPKSGPRLAVSNSVSLPNESAIIGLPCSAPTIRGFSANLLVIDEAASVPDVVYAAARPMLAATNGDLIVSGTADAPTGFFWRILSAEADNKLTSYWNRTVIRAADVTRFSPAFLAEEQVELGPERYAREYECEFSDHRTNGIFKRRIVTKVLKDGVPPLAIPK